MSNFCREIIDESDVFVDVHKAIRRMTPAPRTRVPKGGILTDTARPSEHKLDAVTSLESGELDDRETAQRKISMTELGTSPKVATTFLMRRRSSGNGSMDR